MLEDDDFWEDIPEEELEAEEEAGEEEEAEGGEVDAIAAMNREIAEREAKAMARGEEEEWTKVEVSDFDLAVDSWLVRAQLRLPEQLCPPKRPLLCSLPFRLVPPLLRRPSCASP